MNNYKCDKCNKEFNNKYNYQSHLKRKTPCIKNKKLKTNKFKIIKPTTESFQNLILLSFCIA